MKQICSAYLCSPPFPSHVPRFTCVSRFLLHMCNGDSSNLSTYRHGSIAPATLTNSVIPTPSLDQGSRCKTSPPRSELVEHSDEHDERRREPVRWPDATVEITDQPNAAFTIMTHARPSDSASRHRSPRNLPAGQVM